MTGSAFGVRKAPNAEPVLIIVLCMEEIPMGLHPPCSTATALTSLDVAGIAIVQKEEGWFIASAQQTAGPYATPAAALEASMGWLTESGASQGAENVATHHDEP